MLGFYNEEVCFLPSVSVTDRCQHQEAGQRVLELTLGCLGALGVAGGFA